jgi:hypothetical protein
VRVNLLGKKRNSYGKKEEFLHACFRTTSENEELELEGSYSGHVWQLVGAINS